MSIARNVVIVSGSGGARGLLDFLSPSLRVGGFAVGTSRLFGSYSGPLIRLRRYSDSVEQDAGSGAPRLTSDAVTGLCGKNLQSYSGVSDTFGWSKSRATLAFFGGFAVVTSTATNANGTSIVSPTVATPPATVTLSFRVKKGTGDFCNISVYDNGSNGLRQWVNLSTGALASTATFGTGWSITTSNIVALGGGEYRVLLTFTMPPAASQIRFSYYASTPADGGFGATVGDVGYVADFQIEYGSTATAYEARTTAGASPCLVPKLYDQIGSNHALQINGGYQPQIIPRQIGEKNVMQFDGVDDYLDCGTAVGDYTDNFTIAAWIKASSLTASQRIANRRAIDTQYDFYVDSAIKKLVFFDGTNYVIGATDITVGTWVHSAIVVSGGAGQLYLNGASNSAIAPVLITSRPAESYIIGKRSTAYLNGAMGHHLVLGNALSAAQILAMYNATKGEYGL